MVSRGVLGRTPDLGQASNPTQLYHSLRFVIGARVVSRAVLGRTPVLGQASNPTQLYHSPFNFCLTATREAA